MTLNGKTAVITGASGGIGAAVAHMLHERGVNLGLASRRGSDLGLPDAVASPCDVRDLDALAALCAQTAERFGGIDICPGGVATEFALEEGRGRSEDVLPGMMSAEDVAEVVVFALERPRHFRILETALRPMTEQSWG